LNANIQPRLYICIQHCGVEQLVARWAHNPKATGSSPVPATKKSQSIDWLFAFLEVLKVYFHKRIEK
jgi:hypothetical protein